MDMHAERMAAPLWTVTLVFFMRAVDPFATLIAAFSP